MNRGFSSPPAPAPAPAPAGGPAKSEMRFESNCCGRVDVLEIFLGRVGSVFARTESSLVSAEGEMMSVREFMTDESLPRRFLISLALLIWLLLALLSLICW